MIDNLQYSSRGCNGEEIIYDREKLMILADEGNIPLSYSELPLVGVVWFDSLYYNFIIIFLYYSIRRNSTISQQHNKFI